jgi:hypothetical protein
VSYEVCQRIALQLSLGLTAAFVALLFALHFLEPEFNSGHMISEYQLSEHGSLMSLAFFCLGASSLLLLSVLSPTLRSRGARLDRWGLLLIAVAYFCAGAFPPVPAPAIDGYLHGLSGLLVIFGSPVVFTLVNRNLGRGGEGLSTSRHLRWATILVWIGFLLFVASILISPISITGSTLALVSIFNRLMIATYCVWLMVVAWEALQRRPSV